MKLGAENKKEVVIMAVLLVIALFVMWRTFSSPPSPAQASSSTAITKSEKTAPPKRQSSANKAWRKPKPLVASLDPTLRFDLLKSSEGRGYEGANRNIFGAASEPEKIEKPVCNGTLDKKGKCIAAPPPPPVDPGPPPPPPINLKFYGFANKPGEPKRIFLSSGDDVFIGSEGEIINRRYRILHITGTSVEIEDVLNNNKQTIPLTQG